MKLTTEQLRQIIKEELDAVMTEETIEEDWRDRSDKEAAEACNDAKTKEEHDECMRQRQGRMEEDKE